MDASVIIVNYNTLELIAACIDSIIIHTYGVEYEIIVVDNDSTDGSKEFLSKDKRIKYIQSGENLGFGRANNLGYEYSSGKYVFLLNSDTVLLNNAIKEFYDKMEATSSQIACMGCLLVGKNGQRTHSYGKYPTIKNEIVRRCIPLRRKMPWLPTGFDYCDVDFIDEHSFIVEYITGADLFIRCEVIEKYGLFDKDFFMYYEETEMQHRYRQNGYLSCIIDSPQIIHLEGGGNHSPWRTKSLGGLMIYFRKVHGNIRCIVLKSLLFLLVIPRAIIDYRYPISDRWKYLEQILEA